MEGTLGNLESVISMMTGLVLRYKESRKKFEELIHSWVSSYAEDVKALPKENYYKAVEDVLAMWMEHAGVKAVNVHELTASPMVQLISDRQAISEDEFAAFVGELPKDKLYSRKLGNRTVLHLNPESFKLEG